MLATPSPIYDYLRGDRQILLKRRMALPHGTAIAEDNRGKEPDMLITDLDSLDLSREASGRFSPCLPPVRPPQAVLQQRRADSVDAEVARLRRHLVAHRLALARRLGLDAQ